MADNAKYTFYSWLRRGFAAQLDQVDPLGNNASSTSRPTVALKLDILSEGTTLAEVPKQVSLYGPGEIIGIDRRAVVKTEPKAGVNNFESNYFPYIEFYDEDFPWRYAPFGPNGDRLRPWLTLVVLEDGEFEHLGMTNARLPAIHIFDGALKGIFPPPNQTWAWAHAHINDSFANETGSLETQVDNLLQSDPNAGSSRLLCPRRLKENTNYTAFIIPAFEQGRLAGLGAEQKDIQAVDVSQASWGQLHDGQPDQWPIYYEWSFRTGPVGDFESLVRRLQPRQDLDPRIGRELVDIQAPGFGLQYHGGLEEQDGTIYRTGALRLPKATEPAMTQRTDTDATDFMGKLAELINLDEDLKTKSVGNNFLHNPYFPEETNKSIYEDPIVTPPFYGKHHSGQKRVKVDNQWCNQLNLDPKYRLAAGLGTQVVQKDQENFMERAWLQYGDIIAVNQKIRREQLSVTLSKALYKKHVQSERMPIFDLTVLTEKLHQKVKNGNQTVFRTFDQSLAVSETFVHPQYTKVTRARGPLLRRLASKRLKFIPFKNQDWTKWSVMSAPVYQLANANLAMPTISMIIAVAQAPVPPVIKAHFERGKLVPSSQAVMNTSVNLFQIKASILQKTAPQQQFAARLAATVQLPKSVKPKQEDSIQEIMAAPEFPDPMYKQLSELSTDYLVPNLELLPQESIVLLENNEAFIEAYLLGLNYEMGREFLWREYPADQRGTYFDRFWDAADSLDEEASADILPIHQWPLKTPLGDVSHSPGKTSSELVLTIRGELLRKYPHTIIYMQRAEWENKKGGTRKLKASGKQEVFPLFHAQIDPDIYFLGFDKTAEEARGTKKDPGWFFILKERSGEVRFGLDLDPHEDHNTWDNLSWQDFPEVKNCLDLNRDIPPLSTVREGVAWGKGAGSTPGDPVSGNGNAADMASILYQKPFMVAIHATELIPGD